MDKWDQLAAQMAKEQLKRRGIIDKKILDIISKTPRHQFVLEEFQDRSYDDYPLPIQCNQTISQPYIVALMTQALEVDNTQKILEIGTGSGYQTAILAQLATHVFSLEVHEDLIKKAQKRFEAMDYKNITCVHQSGFFAYSESEVFDRIIVTASPEKLPDVLMNQLKINGIMVIPIGTQQQQLFKIKKVSKSEHIKTKLCDVRFVPMVE